MKIYQTEYNNPNFGAKLKILYKFPFEDRSIQYTNKYIEGDILEMRQKAKCIGGKNDIIEAIFSDWRVNNHEYASGQDNFYTSWQTEEETLKIILKSKGKKICSTIKNFIARPKEELKEKECSVLLNSLDDLQKRYLDTLQKNKKL